VAGAPVIGDADAWADRVAQGIDTLTEHALNGFQGNSGFMPAKGGRLDFADEEVIAAMRYMLDQLDN
jgi:cytochrome c5